MSPGLTPRQRTLARHALGFDGDRHRRTSWRNRFCAFYAGGRGAHADWMVMVEAGLAERHHLTLTYDLFVLTRRGAELALKRGERLDREDFPPAAEPATREPAHA